VSDAKPKNRARHFWQTLRRQSRGRLKDVVAIAVLVVVAIAATLAIIAGQKASLPSWLPFVGQNFVHYNADFSSAQAVTPGQGQAVDIAGIQVGKVSSVELKDGHAVVGLDVEPKYAPLIHPDAQLLLRPKTNLNDMVVEVDPGTGDKQLPDGATIPLPQTEPNVNPEQFLATLDGDTRQYLQLLVAGGAQALGGHGQGLRFSSELRRFGPFAKYISELNGAVAKRRVALARVIHDFRLLTDELGRRDTQIQRFVGSSSEALGAFANRQSSIQQALRELPATLRTAQLGLASSDKLSVALRPTLLGLIPQAQAFAPALRANQRFFVDTLAPIRDQIRPFTRQIRPTVRHASQTAAPFAKTVKGFGGGIGALNYGFNELAYKPKSQQGYLFYLPWLNHDLNATYMEQSGSGALRRSIIMLSCNSATLTEGAVTVKPFLHTLQQATNVPTNSNKQVCP
jgi:phospholipid/cholesterol/gamma-HCH transport system substrate-binding protein